MTVLRNRRFGIAKWILASSVIGLMPAVSAKAQTAENLLLIINDKSQASVEIADYYARKRAVPAANIVHVSAALSDDISRPDFQRDIETPIADWFARTAAY